MAKKVATKGATKVATKVATEGDTNLEKCNKDGMVEITSMFLHGTLEPPYNKDSSIACQIVGQAVD